MCELQEKQDASLLLIQMSHNREHFRYMRLGVAVARRSWLEEKDVVNALPLKGLMKLLKH